MEVDLIVKAITQGFDKLNKDIAGTGTAVNDSGKAAQTGGMRFTELASKISIAQQAYAAVAGVAGKAYEMIGEGAQLELSRARFDNLAASIGTTADALQNDLSAATGGMTSNAEQIASASQIISLGLADNQKDVVDLASLVSQLGWDMQQVILTFANNSKMRLDALGLSVTDVDERTQKFIEQGYNMDKAFDMAVIDAGKAKLELLGSAADTTAGSMARLEAHTKNVTDAFKEMMAGRWEGMLGGLANTIDAQGSAWDKLVVSGAEFNKMMFGAQGVWGPAADKIRAAADETANYEARLASATNAEMTAWEARKALVQVTEEHVVNIAAVNRILGMQSPIVAKDTRELEEMAYASGELGDTQDRLTGYLKEDTEALKQQEDAAQKAAETQRALASASGDYFTSAISGNNELAAALAGTGQRTAFVSNLTGQQADDLTRMQTAYDKAAGTIRDYELGIKGANLTDDARNKKIEEQIAIMATLDGNMQPLLAAGGQYVTTTEDGNAQAAALNSLLYEAADAAGADAMALAGLMSMTGEYTKEQINAALQTAAVTAKANELAQQLADGTITVGEATQALQEFAQDWQANATIQVADDSFRGLLRDLVAFDGKTYRATAKVDTEGSVPSSGGGDGKGDEKGKKPGFATGTGGWATVPGPVGAPYPVTLHGGEPFNVMPVGSSPQGGGGNIALNITINADTSQPAAVGMASRDGALQALRSAGLI